MAQLWISRIASTYSRIRSAGADHGIENRLVIRGLICEPTPSRNRSPEYI